jgi:SPX domain protein involved in polyphosphate accumulation
VPLPSHFLPTIYLSIYLSMHLCFVSLPSLPLALHSEINFLGVSKIVKKYDKNMNESRRVAVVAQYSTAELHRSVELEELISAVEQVYTRLAVELAIVSVMLPWGDERM